MRAHSERPGPVIVSGAVKGASVAGLHEASGSDPSTRAHTRDDTAGTVARAALEASFALLVEHEPELLTSRDPVHVHQARVATRRLRSDLRTFRPLFDAAWVNDLRADLRALADALGAVRDADVLFGRLDRRVAELPGFDRYAAQPLLDRAHVARERTRAELAPLLESRRHDELRVSLAEAARTPPLRDRALQPADAVLPTLVRKPWRRLRRKVRRLGDDPSDAALHDTRIALKRCRYAVSAVAPVVGAPAEGFAKALARVQDRLGEHQDAVQAEAWLRANAATVEAPAAFVAGVLAAIERRAAEDARGSWRPAWKAARRLRLR